MQLQTLKLLNFRNFPTYAVRFQYPCTMIVGPNAQGKTNLLEAIYVAVQGYGFRESKEEELIKMGESTAMIEGTFIENEEKTKLSIHLQKKESGVEKKYTVNTVKRSSSLYQNSGVHTILFSPDQLLMITGSPSERRKYFDRLIGYYDSQYRSKLINYENGLRKRNKILERHTNDQQLKEELSFWNEYLEEQASYITRKRSEYVAFLQKYPQIDETIFTIEHVKSEFTREKLGGVYELEKRMRKTAIGPQRDDFQIYKIKNTERFNIHHFGSRSEQRLSLFWLHWNEVRFYEQNMHKKPIILLDDIFSELDLANKQLVSHFIKEYQTIMTTTEKELQGYLEIPESAIISL